MKKVLIDNGHGAETKGKRSPDGILREYRYCREIARETVRRLCGCGVDAILLVPEEGDVSLAERVRRANALCDKLGAGNVCLVSIHLNAAGDGSRWMAARGWEAWTSRGHTQGDRLADCLYDAALESLPAGMSIRTDMTDGDRDKESDFAIVRKTRCAATLTENLFMDNRNDAAYLMSDAGREAIAGLHVSGIMRYLNGRLT